MNWKRFPVERQLDTMDCGPTCLKMISKFYGKFYSLQYLRDKCGVTKEGVSFLDLSHAAEDIGLRTLSIKCTIEDLLNKIPLPAIAHWDNSHFIVVYKRFMLQIQVRELSSIQKKSLRPNGLPKTMSPRYQMALKQAF